MGYPMIEEPDPSESWALLRCPVCLDQAVPVTWEYMLMKSLIVGLVLVAATWSASAGDLRGTGMLQQSHATRDTPDEPWCGGQEPIPIYNSQGQFIGWRCPT